MKEVEVWYDDRIDDVISQVNILLAEYGLRIVDDGAEHDDYCLYHVERLNATKQEE